jgi:hypothetical protein
LIFENFDRLMRGISLIGQNPFQLASSFKRLKGAVLTIGQDYEGPGK